MAKRPGFTLLEVLVASAIIMIALLGIASMGMNALRKSNLPDDVEKASLLAAERISYYRAQRNQYVAVGGTYHPAPAARYIPDLNQPPHGDNVNNIINGRVQLFVREYLHETSEGRYAGEAGRQAQAGRFGVQNLNVVPATPDNVVAVLPNVLGTGAGGEPGVPGVPPSPQGWTGTNFNSIKAPRANDTLVDGQRLPATIRFVREVWIQTNQPNYQPSSNTLFGGQGLPALSVFSINATDTKQVPALIPNIPAYSVAVTVRVFARDKQTDTLAQIVGGAVVRNPGSPGNLPSGPGYDRKRPLAQVSAIFSLKRGLNE